jgi:fatty aldehyde-generating acyl-ACP reductase
MTDASEPVDFALLGHPADYEHFADLVLRSKPDFEAAKLRRHQPLLRKFFDWTPSYATHHRLVATDPQGRRVTGRMIVCTFLPDALQSPRNMLLAYQKTLAGCRVAQTLGARILALGGMTSIVSGDQGRKVAAELGLAATSGNSLTAAIALDQIERVLARLEWDLSERSLAVVGASGDIGRACTFRLAPRARRLLLIGRNLASLERMREELPAGLDISLSTKVPAALGCDVILTATSAAEPLLDESELVAGTVVFDVGYPRNVRSSTNPRPDTLLIPVGRAQLPFSLPLSDYTRLGDPTLLFGCFTEAIVLALSGQFESYSVGQGCITEQRMSRILALARDCGVTGTDPFARAVPRTTKRDRRLGYSELEA